MNPDLLLATGGSDCERVTGDLLAQPVNTLSSFAYVVVGTWVALRAQGTSRRVFGALVVAVGAGSIAYHGWDGRGVSLVHDLTIVAVAVFIVGFEVTHARGERRPAGYVVAVVALAIGLAANLLGRSGAPLCAPGSVVQWHALWHVATAAALGAWAWAALEFREREEVRWEGSTARSQSSPAPVRGSAGA